MPALNDPGAAVDPNYKKFFATYPKSIDPILASTLAAGGLDYGTWSHFGKDTQSQVQMFLGMAGPWGPAGSGNAGGQMFDGPQDIMPFLVNSGAITPAQQKALQAGTITAPASSSTTQQKGLVAQPKATSGGSGGAGGGIPGYVTPKITSGQLASFLKMQGYNFPFDTKKFFADALKNSNGDMNLAQDIFMGEMIKSPQFKAYYPNIFDKSGRMIVSITDYDNNVASYQALASRQGFKVTRQQAGILISGQVSPDEFKQRTEMAATVKKNHDLFKSFNDVLKAQGLPQIKNAQDAFNFLNGKASPKQYQAWNAATAESAAKAAGLQVNAKEALAATKPLNAAANFADIEKSYATIADQLKSSGVELSGYGLNQKDLETIQFGGANRGLLAARAQQALDQRQAQVGTTVQGEVGLNIPVAEAQPQQATA